MRIEIQIEYLQNYFNTVNIINESSKAKMSNQVVERIRKLIKTNKKDCTKIIDGNFTIEFKDLKVSIKDTK
jgi:hypothetical protein